MTTDALPLVSLIFEAAVVKRIERTGWQILGGHKEGVGEHSFITAVISYFLAKKLKAHTEKVLVMAIFHDFHEARTGEVDKLAKFYIQRNEAKANEDIFKALDTELFVTLEEYEQKESLESRIVYEANVLAFLVELKLLIERGHTIAPKWYEGNKKRLRIPEVVELAEKMQVTDSQIWWKSLQEELEASFLTE